MDNPYELPRLDRGIQVYLASRSVLMGRDQDQATEFVRAISYQQPDYVYYLKNKEIAL